MIKRVLLQLALLFVLTIPVQGQDAQKVNLTFFGSSVCYGAGATDKQGYAWMFYNRNDIDTSAYNYFNASTGGDNTIRLEKYDRLTNKLYPTDPDVAVIGLSLGNEGIRSPVDDNGRERILEQFRSRLLALADSLTRLDIQPVIVNCYAHSLFTADHYRYTKRMNRMINTWPYPSINVLGTIDDGAGRWVNGYVNDPWHPNTAGHREMSYALVPSLFDALQQRKSAPSHDWNKSFGTVKNENAVPSPLSFDVTNTIHSFTLSFRFKETENGSIAGVISNNTNHAIKVDGFYISYKDLITIYHRHLRDWTHIVLSHSYANQKTMLIVNGELIGTVDEQLVPSQVHFGGTATSTELKDLALHRAALNTDEALDLYHKKFIQSSLEFYNPLTQPTRRSHLVNRAQSLSLMSLAPEVTLQHNPVEF